MEEKYSFRARMCEVHPKREAGAARACPDGYLDLSTGCTVILPAGADAVTLHAADDLCDYLAVSQGVTATAAKGAPLGPAIRLALRADRPADAPTGSEERAYRILVDDAGVTVVANTGKGLFAATVYLEEQMSEAGGPFLKKGETDRRPLFSPRMVHSGYELDVFPEPYMNRLAHDGYDTLLVFVKGANLSPRGECDFNALIATAARYGLDVYAYSYMVSEKHPDDEGAEEFYESTYGNLFKTNPGFRGVVLVGESCEFPSHDERAHPWLNRYNKNPDGTLRSNKVNARTFPVSDYPEWIAMVKRIIRKYRPDADFLFWSYNWGYRPADVRVALIDNLPTDISLQATFEMFEPLPAPEGVSERTTDYSICIPGPGGYFLSEAEAAKRRGLRLYTISNTAGTTWDVGIVPYIPAPEVWGERYDKLLECHEKYGLCGLMEGHHYGAYHSFISELSKEMGWSPRRDFREHMRAIAVRDYGEENADAVLSAWHHASEGIRHNIPSVEDQYGPLRVGPAYPLATMTYWTPPSPDFAHFGGNRITYTWYGIYRGFPATSILRNVKRLLHGISEFSIMQREYDEAARLFADVAKGLTGRAQAEAGRMAAHLYLMARTAETTVNVKRFSALRHAAMEMTGTLPTHHHLMEQVTAMPIYLTNDPQWPEFCRTLFDCEPPTPAALLALARRVAEEECDNARRAIPAVEYDSRLGWEASMEYMCDREHLLWKIDCTEKAVAELAEMLSPLL
ncbi:MAG: hypothetical protein J6T24_01350 [Clostridia bacterium]|nr:hypothetical protein [Clostridia bacterium]